MAKSSNGPSNPHDRFFRRAFEKREVAQAFFERYLPAEISTQLDFSSLNLSKESFIDETLKARQSDLVFTISTVEDRPVRLYLLLEHKSYADPWVGLQLLSYVVRLWERERSQLTLPPLPAVIPMVLYHGPSRSGSAPTFESLLDSPDWLTPFIPQFPFAFYDLHQESLEQLQDRAWLAVTLQVLKYIRSETLPERLTEILALFQQLMAQRDEALAFLTTVLRYLAQAAGQLDEPLIRTALTKALSADVGEQIMPTLAETWLEQGRQQGIEQGMQQGIQQGIEQGARQALRRQLSKHFGALSEAIELRIDAADQPLLDTWLDRVIEAPSLDAVFSDQE